MSLEVVASAAGGRRVRLELEPIKIRPDEREVQTLDLLEVKVEPLDIAISSHEAQHVSGGSVVLVRDAGAVRFVLAAGSEGERSQDCRDTTGSGHTGSL